MKNLFSLSISIHSLKQPPRGITKNGNGNLLVHSLIKIPPSFLFKLMYKREKKCLLVRCNNKTRHSFNAKIHHLKINQI